MYVQYMWQIIIAIPAIVFRMLTIVSSGSLWGGEGGEAVDNNIDVFL